MDRAFQGADSVQETPNRDEMVMGVPRARPGWLVPAIIGAVVVLVGVIGTALFLR
jgi:hypothetical protein